MFSRDSGPVHMLFYFLLQFQHPMGLWSIPAILKYTLYRWGYRRWVTLSSHWPTWLEPWLLTLIQSQRPFIGLIFFKTKSALPRQMWDNLLSIHTPYLHSFTVSCSSPSRSIVWSFLRVSHPFLSFFHLPSLPLLPPSHSSLPSPTFLPSSFTPFLASLPLLPLLLPSPPSIHLFYFVLWFYSLSLSPLISSLYFLFFFLASPPLTLLSSHPPPTPTIHPRLSSSGLQPENLSGHQPQPTLRNSRGLVCSQALLVKQRLPTEYHWSVRAKWDQSDDSSLWRS